MEKAAGECQGSGRKKLHPVCNTVWNTGGI